MYAWLENDRIKECCVYVCCLVAFTDTTVENEFFVYLEDITANTGYLKGWKIFKMTAVALDQNTFQELAFKAVKNRKRSSRSPAGQID